jgi:hypothetical protein
LGAGTGTVRQPAGEAAVDFDPAVAAALVDEAAAVLLVWV